MENIPNAIEAVPELAPWLIGGALIGALCGLMEDLKADDGLPHRWWHYGAWGAVPGGVAGLALRNDGRSSR